MAYRFVIGSIAFVVLWRSHGFGPSGVKWRKLRQRISKDFLIFNSSFDAKLDTQEPRLSLEDTFTVWQSSSGTSLARIGLTVNHFIKPKSTITPADRIRALKTTIDRYENRKIEI